MTWKRETPRPAVDDGWDSCACAGQSGRPLSRKWFQVREK